MNPNQELYAKALEIAVLLLGPRNDFVTDGKQSTFNIKFQDYRNLAVFIAKDIVNAPNGIFHD
jgi:hypothetical protein